MDDKILVEVSARHVHLDRKTMNILFGEGSELTYVRDLSQPGQFLTEERVDVIGKKRTLCNVGILGPLRPATQVELSLTDCFLIGTIAPVRESGDIAGTPGVVLKGPKGEVELKEGLIVAKRHIHVTPADAERLGIKDKEIVKVKIESDRSVVYDDVIVRVSPKYAPAMHIDTDEGNAALVGKNGCEGKIVK